MTTKVMTPKTFAALVFMAQEMHDKSWNGKSHNISHDLAVRMLCKSHGYDEAWVVPIALLNIAAWNDIQAWAYAIQLANEGDDHGRPSASGA